MTGAILKAVVNEVCAFLNQRKGGREPGTCMIEDDFKKDDQRTYIMPLVLLDMMDANDASSYPGGVTRMDWSFGMNTYAYMPDVFNDDPTTYSTELLAVIDELRRHFQNGICPGNWLVPERVSDDLPMSMEDITKAYGFKFTLSGLIRAKHLQMDGLIMGWRIVFDSVSVDMDTDTTPYSTEPLEGVDPVGYPEEWEPFS